MMPGEFRGGLPGAPLPLALIKGDRDSDIVVDKCHGCNGTGYVGKNIRCRDCGGSGEAVSLKRRQWG